MKKNNIYKKFIKFANCFICSSKKRKAFRAKYSPEINVSTTIIKYLNNLYPNLQISLLDVGARNGLEASGLFTQILEFKNKEIYGIEPDENEAKRLLGLNQYKEISTNALFDIEATGPLYFTETPGCSSLLEPNEKMLQELNLMISDWFKVEKVINIETKTLKQIFPNKTFDYIKIDTQGTEMNIIKSFSQEILDKCICIHCEAQSIKFYKNQFLIGELLNYMSANNFIPLTLAPVKMDGMDLEFNITFLKNPILIKKSEDLIKHIMIGLFSDLPDYIAYLLRTHSDLLDEQFIKVLRSNLELSYYEQKYRIQANKNI